MDDAAHGDEVLLGARNGTGIDVGGMEVDLRDLRCESDADRTDAATKVDHHDGAARSGNASNQGCGLLHEETAACARHEHTVIDREPDTAEVGPAHDVLQWFSGCSAGHHRVELLGRAGRLGQDRGFFRGVHAPRPGELAGGGIDGHAQTIAVSLAARHPICCTVGSSPLAGSGARCVRIVTDLVPFTLVLVSDFRDQWDRHFVGSVRDAAQRAFEVGSGRPAHEVYGVLSEELRRRGIEPEPDAVFEGARLISRGRKPPVLREAC